MIKIKHNCQKKNEGIEIICDKEGYWDVYLGNDVLVIDIKFCPYCGEKLNKPKKMELSNSEVYFNKGTLWLIGENFDSPIASEDEFEDLIEFMETI